MPFDHLSFGGGSSSFFKKIRRHFFPNLGKRFSHFTPHSLNPLAQSVDPATSGDPPPAKRLGLVA
jgi:hypothetical protein